MRILFSEADLPQELNTSWWRCRIPAYRLKQAGHDTLVAHNSLVFTNSPPQQVADFLHTAEVVVVERVFVDFFIDKIKEWKALGKRVVGTFDDAYHLIDPSKETGKFWRGKKTDYNTGNFKQFRANLSLFDRVIVPSHVLVDDYKPYCKDVRYVANYTMKELWENIKRRPPDNNIVIGWGGSTGHVKSWRDSGIITALARLQRKYPRMMVRIYGGGTEIPDYLKKAGVKCEFQGWMAFELWPQHIAMWDVGVIPLSGNYDSRRSHIKCLENAMAGKAWVASEGEPYKDARGGLLVKNSPDDWQHAIDSILSGWTDGKHLAYQGYEWALAQTAECVPAYESALGSW